MKNQSGCDSTITLHLTINKSTSTDTTVDSCDRFTWYGQTYTATPLTAPTHTLTTASGCDSIITLHLTIRKSVRIDSFVSACDSFVWQGNTYYSSSSYQYNDTKSDGCDSIVMLLLTIKESYHRKDSLAICHHQLPYEWRGNVYYGEEAINDTLLAYNGCDSIVVSSLVVLPDSISNADSVTSACSFFDWRGYHIQQSGVYYDTVRGAVQGLCDSIYVLYIDISPSIDTLDTVVCDNNNVVIHGNSYNISGSYLLRFQDTNGCDSLVLLQVSIKPTYSTTQFAVLCANNPYYWIDGNAYDSLTTQPFVSLTATNGCDSVVHLNLWQVEHPQASFQVSHATVDESNSMIVLTNTSQNFFRLMWLLHDGSTDSSREVMFSYPEGEAQIKVGLIVESENGCLDSAFSQIIYEPLEISPPNCFTPDIPPNHRFLIPSQNMAKFEAHIYSRQGLLVYTFKDKNDSWDGTSHGQNCPQGSYIYIVRYTSTLHPDIWHTINGTVTLIR
ncbi:MAG: gliding motility-associated C-terminal domain-containing protein [Bacteroidales bacterium]|nr:gliding motility-associated C-terminal domain-containing protein [Candidatus Colimorpha onthohippi]